MVKGHFSTNGDIPTGHRRSRRFRNIPALPTSGLNAAASHSIHSIEGTDSAGGIEQQDLPEQPTERPGVELCEDATDNGGGRAVPYPYGGKSRLVSVDLDTAAMQAKHNDAGRLCQRYHGKI